MRIHLAIILTAIIIATANLYGCVSSSFQKDKNVPNAVENSVDTSNDSIVGSGVGLKFFAANGCTYCIDKDGQLFGWGRNFDGSLGFSEDIIIEKPIEIPIPEKVVDLSPGVFSVALSENGNIYSWGVVSFGSESSERIIDTTPVKVSVPEKIVRIFNGHGSVGLAQGESGITYIWGWNLQGLMANGKTEHSFEPIILDISSRILEISCYDTHVIALCEDGKVYTWGSNYYGELGDNSEIDISRGLVERNRLKPDVVNLDEPIVSVAAGRGVSYALSEDGNLYAWGANDVGQLGLGKEVTHSSSPLIIPFDSKIKAVIAGAFHTYALTEDGELWGWGYNSRDYEDMSVLGIGSYERVVYVPTQIIIEENVEYITTGTVHTFVATQDGSILSWGENGTKAVSFETNKNVDTPILWRCGD